METFKSVEVLKKYFQTTSEEELQAGWNALDCMEFCGPSLEELLVPYDDWVNIPSCDVNITCECQKMVTTSSKNYSLAA